MAGSAVLDHAVHRHCEGVSGSVFEANIVLRQNFGNAVAYFCEPHEFVLVVSAHFISPSIWMPAARRAARALSAAVNFFPRPMVITVSISIGGTLNTRRRSSPTSAFAAAIRAACWARGTQTRSPANGAPQFSHVSSNGSLIPPPHARYGARVLPSFAERTAARQTRSCSDAASPRRSWSRRSTTHPLPYGRASSHAARAPIRLDVPGCSGRHRRCRSAGQVSEHPTPA